MTVVKEACVDNIQDAINAFRKGADRIEFCSNLDEDGLTPSNYDLISLKKYFYSSEGNGKASFKFI